MFLWLIIGVGAAIGLGMTSDRVRSLPVAGVAIVVYLGSYFVWFALRYLAVVPSEAVARGLCLEAHELADPLVAVLASTLPPAIPVGLLLLYSHARRKRHGTRRS